MSMTPSEKITNLIAEGKIINLTIAGVPKQGIFADVLVKGIEEPIEVEEENLFSSIDDAFEWMARTCEEKY